MYVTNGFSRYHAFWFGEVVVYIILWSSVLYIMTSVIFPPQVGLSISGITTTPCFPREIRSWGICFDLWIDLVVQLWIFLWDCFSVSTPFAKVLVLRTVWNVAFATWSIIRFGKWLLDFSLSSSPGMFSLLQLCVTPAGATCLSFWLFPPSEFFSIFLLLYIFHMIWNVWLVKKVLVFSEE